MRWYVYILRCADGSLYVGRTINWKRRLIQHNEGKGSLFTKNKIPVKLERLEIFDSLNGAFNREFQIKRWTREKKENLIKFGKPYKNIEKVIDLKTSS